MGRVAENGSSLCVYKRKITGGLSLLEVLLRFLHHSYLLTADVLSLRSYVLIAEVGVCFERLVALKQIIAPCSFFSTWMSHNVCLQVKIIQHNIPRHIKVRSRYLQVSVLQFVFISWTICQRAAHLCVLYILGNICNFVLRRGNATFFLAFDGHNVKKWITVNVVVLDYVPSWIHLTHWLL